MQPHRLDTVSLIAGVIFAGIGAAYLFGFNLASRWALVARSWPLLLVAVGVVVLLSARRTPDDD